jgi:hypothetical protein
MTAHRSIVLLCIAALNPLNLLASYDDYLTGLREPSFSDYGTIGLIHMPSARMMPVGSLAFRWARGQPYFRGSIVATPFSRMEALYKYTDINTELYSDDKGFSGGQSLKDKAFDAKFILNWESRFLPQIAIGIRDFGGTDRFAAEYVVASKYYRNFDLTFGMGWGTLSGGPDRFENPMINVAEQFRERGQSGRSGTGGGLSPDQWLGGEYASLFGGLEYYFPQKRGMSFKIELDPTDYQKEGDRSSPLEQTSRINWGFSYPVSENFKLSLGWVRGNTLSIGFSFSGAYADKDPLNIKSKQRKKINNSEIIKRINTRNKEAYYLSTLKYLNEEELFVQAAEINANEINIVYSQSKHQSYIRAAGRAASILDKISPENIQRFSLSTMNSGIIMNTVSIPRNTFAGNLDTKNYQEIKYSSEIYKTSERLKFEDYEFQPKGKFPVHFLKFTPALRNHIGGPDGFYFGEAYLRASQTLILSRNLSINALYSLSIADNFDTLKLESDSVLEHVRTDVIKYLKGGRGFSISRLQLDYIFEPYNDIYAKFSAGLHEEMFGGIGGEVLYRPFYSNHAIGVDFAHVKQRSYQQMFDFKDYSIVTGHVNYYYSHPASKILFTMKGGRYLAGDSGVTFDFSRRFKSGMYMGAFFSKTDISKEEFGEGSFDKGFYFSFPLEIFFRNYSRGRTYFGLKPLTRDGGARLIRAYNLYGVTDMGSYNAMDRDWDDIYD